MVKVNVDTETWPSHLRAMLKRDAIGSAVVEQRIAAQVPYGTFHESFHSKIQPRSFLSPLGLQELSAAASQLVNDYVREGVISMSTDGRLDYGRFVGNVLDCLVHTDPGKPPIWRQWEDECRLRWCSKEPFSQAAYNKAVAQAESSPLGKGD